MMRSRVHALILAITVCLAAPAEAQTTLSTGTVWLLDTLQHRAPLAEARVTLQFGDATFDGNDGCNRYNGTYTATDQTIAVGKDIASTMMGCAEPVMQQASEYLAALREAVRYEVSGARLTLSSASGATLAVFTQQSLALAGTNWKVTAYNNGHQAVVSVLPRSVLDVEFGEEGRLAGRAGCNSFAASYTTSGAELQIGPVMATRKACSDPSGIMEQEGAFLSALQTSARYRVEGDRLTLSTAGGEAAVTCIRQRSPERDQ